MLKSVLSDVKSVLRGNVLILFITWILLGFGNNMVHKFDGLYFSALGASDVVLGYMGAITFGMMALLQMPGGYLADTLGRRKVIVVFTFVMASSILIFALAPSWEYIVIGLAISNMALLYQPALFSIIMDSLPPSRRAEGFAVTNLAMLPSLAAPMVGGVLIQSMGVVPGMRLGYFILFLLSITAGFLRLRLRETVSRSPRKEREGFLSFFRVLREINPVARWLIPIGMLSSAANGMVAYFVVKHAYSYSSPFIFGVAMAVNMILYTIVGIFVGRIGDLRGKEKFYIAGLLLSSLSLTLLIFPSVLFLFAYSITLGLGMAFFQPSSQGLIADLVETRRRGRYTGVMLFISYLGTMAMSALAGYLFNFSPQLLFTVAALLLLVAALMAVRVLLIRKSANEGL